MNCSIDDTNLFYEELKKSLLEDTTYEDTCLITNEPLKNVYITLNCNHKFNYDPIYKEICVQKDRPASQKLSLTQIRCPYCRIVQNSLLPQIDGWAIKAGVNSPSKYCMFINKCKYVSRNGTLCNKSCNSEYCVRHNNLINKKTIKEEEYKKKRCACTTISGKRCKNIGKVKINNSNDILICSLHDKIINNYTGNKTEILNKLIKL